MAMSMEALDRLVDELEAAQERAAAREATLEALLAKTREQAEKWAVDWQHATELLEERRHVLEAQAASPDTLVRTAGENLDETEEELRSFLRAAQELADRIG